MDNEVIQDIIPTIIIVESSKTQLTVIEKQSENIVISSGQGGASNIDISTLAKESKQDTANNSLASIDSKLTSPLSVDVINYPLTQDVNVLNFPATQPISAANLPLPTGAATSANQLTEIASLSNIDTKLNSQATNTNQVTANNSLSSIDTKLTNNATTTLQSAGNSSLSNIDSNLGAKSDLVASSDTGAFSLISLFKRLLDRLTSIISVKITDGAGVVNSRALGSQLINGDIGLVTNSIIHGETTGGGGGYRDVKVNPSGALTVEATVTNAILPTGASTSANQTTTNNLLTSIDNGIQFKPSALFDAGGRQRVSQISTLGDYKILNSDELLLLENIGTGTGAWANNKYNLSVTSGQFFIRRSRSYHHYFSGKSQLVELTFDNFQSESNTVKRVGYFSSNAISPYDSDKDGFWLENTGATIDLVVSRFGTETLRKNITTWDGYSSLSTYDWSKFTVILFDFLWLGGAVLRLFVKTDLGFVLAHTFNYSGTSTDTFMLSPNHSIRYEIRSTTGTGSLRYICAQVATEGSVEESGKQKAIDNGSTDITVATIGTTYPIKAIRKKSTHRDNAVKITGAQLFVSSNTDRGLMSVCLNPTFSAPLTYTDVANGAIQEANGNGTITATNKGTVLFSKYITQNSVFDAKVFEADFLTWLDESIDNVSDVIAVCITPLTSGITTNAVINYKEY